MGALRTHIILPEDLAKDIDELVGPRGRSAFLVETAQAEIRKRKLLEFFSRTEPAWKVENHPELSDGASAWVKTLRSESSHRTSAAEKARSPKD
jgi:hypothetical protein